VTGVILELKPSYLDILRDDVGRVCNHESVLMLCSIHPSIKSDNEERIPAASFSITGAKEIKNGK
jgi:hypothetical protein